jgi:hypothetical protein
MHYRLLRQEFLAFPAYLLFNVSGQKNYPAWTNHFDPNSILFTKEQWGRVMMSNFGIAAMIFGVQQSCRIWGASEVMKYYFIPWLVSPAFIPTKPATRYSANASIYSLSRTGSS